MKLPPIVSQDEWQTAHARMLEKEKQATRARDALAAERRRQPMVRIDKDYVFEGRDGKAHLRDLFEGRRMGWNRPWYSSEGSHFNRDMGVTTDQGETFGLSVFLRDGDDIFRSYHRRARCRSGRHRLVAARPDTVWTSRELGRFTRRLATDRAVHSVAAS